MSNVSNSKFLNTYFQDASPLLFLAGLFATPRKNFHRSESIEFDVVRSGEKVAVAVQDVGAGYRQNSTSSYTNKQLTPPVFKESIPLTSADLLKRHPGDNPFAETSYRSKLTDLMFRGMRLQEDKIRRSNELQASQVLQTGTVTLTDTAGIAIYEVDYQPKATHFPTAGTAWTGAADIAGDLISLANVIKSDGKVTPDTLIMGEASFEAMITNSNIQLRYDNRRINRGDIKNMVRRGNGQIFQGTITVGNWNFDIITYPERYDAIVGGASTQFIADDKVVMLSSQSTVLEASFGGVPHIGRELGIDGRNILPGLPGRFGSSEAGMDMFTNVWLSENGEQIFGGVASRPLFIPKGIDTYGCIDTGV